jgi:hypothetical protein
LLLVQLQLLLKQRLVVSTAASRPWPANNLHATLLQLLLHSSIALLLQAAVHLRLLLQVVWVLLLVAMQLAQ